MTPSNWKLKRLAFRRVRVVRDQFVASRQFIERCLAFANMRRAGNSEIGFAADCDVGFDWRGEG